MEKNNKALLVNEGTTPAIYRTRRDVILWRTPGFGFVEMYINPTELRIEQSKVSQTTRTKAGFIYQYAGENLTLLTISGTTGSSGIEGINLLEKIYRSEQLSFDQMAKVLDSNPKAASGVESAMLAMSNAFNIPSIIGGEIVNSIASTVPPDVYSQPFPTLASLAAAVEMNFQGVTYRGFFTSFGFTESASSPGLFEYNIGFTSYSKVGERINFMPWHRRPEAQSDSNSLSNFSLPEVETEGYILTNPAADVQKETARFITASELQNPVTESTGNDRFFLNSTRQTRRPITSGTDLSKDIRFNK
jgi:hypothetical protein